MFRSEEAAVRIGAAMSGADIVAIPVARLDEAFFVLSTRVAGEIMQKFANYRLRLAVVGDISHHLDSSDALRALVRESRAASHIWFLPDIEALDARLEAMAAGGHT
ncbi:DUF4180 domain-containing protein [Streptomyces bohaiensis]|uniref:DUF4180 domain-containing protein n=1 Tax=Streptomyces bohaiensis TaxID=1431344 RepID=UPI003B817AA5